MSSIKQSFVWVPIKEVFVSPFPVLFDNELNTVTMVKVSEVNKAAVKPCVTNLRGLYSKCSATRKPIYSSETQVFE